MMSLTQSYANVTMTTETFLDFTSNTSILSNLSTNATSLPEDETTDPSSLGPVRGDLISTKTQELLNLIDFIIIQAVILFPGIVANVINMLTFIQLGLTDTVTISFFALTVSDIACLLIAVYNWLCYTLYRIPKDWPVNMFDLMYLGVWYFQMTYDVSMLITTYAAVQKCCCIALPIKFRRVFTRSRTIVVIIMIWLFSIACYAPLLAAQGLQERRIDGTNITRYTIAFASYRQEALAVNDIIIRIILQNACEVIVIACLFILTISLRKQSKFRHCASTGNVSGFGKGISSASFNNLHHAASVTSVSSSGDSVSSVTKNNNSKENLTRAHRISSKELQVIKSVTLVSTIFVLANFPRIVLSIARTIVPEMDTFRRYHNLHLTLQMFRRVVEVSGASINFIIYFKFNNRFRQLVSDRFGCCSKE